MWVVCELLDPVFAELGAEERVGLLERVFGLGFCLATRVRQVLLLEEPRRLADGVRVFSGRRVVLVVLAVDELVLQVDVGAARLVSAGGPDRPARLDQLVVFFFRPRVQAVAVEQLERLFLAAFEVDRHCFVVAGGLEAGLVRGGRVQRQVREQQVEAEELGRHEPAERAHADRAAALLQNLEESERRVFGPLRERRLAEEAPEVFRQDLAPACRELGKEPAQVEAGEVVEPRPLSLDAGDVREDRHEGQAELVLRVCVVGSSHVCR